MPRLRVGAASALVATLVAASLGLAGASAEASGTSMITGTVYQDLNRNQVQDAGESPMPNEGLFLFDASGTSIASAATDANGHFSFGGLADGTYRVAFDQPSWMSLRDNWTPTTTGSIYFSRTVALSGSAVADFGLRPIVRSTTLGSPITAFAGTNGLHTESYDDVISAQQVYNDIMGASLIGAEASDVTVRFDYGSTTYTSASIGGTSYSAQCYIAWDPWLNEGDEPLFHEYGHAWALYFANMVHQDPNLTTYLQARGLYGNSLVGSSMYWDPEEMIAEDYRQLFGTANAASYPQANTQIPAAAQVSGLKSFLANTFTQPPAGSGGGTGSGGGSTPPPPPPPTVSITNLGVTPQPVVKTATVGFSLSLAATTSVSILDAKGSLVRTLLSSTAEPAGNLSLAWNRLNNAGQRVKSGTYTTKVTALDAYGHTVVASTPVSAS